MGGDPVRFSTHMNFGSITPDFRYCPLHMCSLSEIRSASSIPLETNTFLENMSLYFVPLFAATLNECDG